MRLERLALHDSFRSLQPFEYEFAREDDTVFSPIALVGPNGSGKSHFQELLAELFVFADARRIGHSATTLSRWKALRVECEYSLASGDTVLLSAANGTLKFRRNGEEVEPTAECLPSAVLGYSSGHNETLSQPFRYLEAAYSRHVLNSALNSEEEVTEPICLWSDLEANRRTVTSAFLWNQVDWVEDETRASGIAQFLITLDFKVNGIEVILTDDLAETVEALRFCTATVGGTEKHQRFNFLVSAATLDAFEAKFGTARALNNALHRLALLNPIGLAKADRDWDAGARNLDAVVEMPVVPASARVFTIDGISVETNGGNRIPYERLSDGEHQLLHLASLLSMYQDDEDLLMLLDEPTTHWNPIWRRRAVEILARNAPESESEMLVSTHSPQVTSGFHGHRTLVFSAEEDATFRESAFETFGASYEFLVRELFGVGVPISSVAVNRLNTLLTEATSAEQLAKEAGGFGPSDEKLALYSRMRELAEDG